jgi:hypothetical protein
MRVKHFSGEPKRGEAQAAQRHFAPPVLRSVCLRKGLFSKTPTVVLDPDGRRNPSFSRRKTSFGEVRIERRQRAAGIRAETALSLLEEAGFPGCRRPTERQSSPSGLLPAPAQRGRSKSPNYSLVDLILSALKNGNWKLQSASFQVKTQTVPVTRICHG